MHRTTIKCKAWWLGRASAAASSQLHVSMFAHGAARSRRSPLDRFSPSGQCYIMSSAASSYAVNHAVRLWTSVMAFLCLSLAKTERHLLKILSHHILVSASQHEDTIQGNPGTFWRGSRKPAWQPPTHSSNSNMSGWTIITPHLDTSPNREQVFGPILAPLCTHTEGCMHVGTHGCRAV